MLILGKLNLDTIPRRVYYMEIFFKYSGYISLILGSFFVISSMPTLYQTDDDIDFKKYKIRFYIGCIFISIWLISIFFIK